MSKSTSSAPFVELTEEQSTAVANSRTNESHMSILYGPPGSGKTETIRKIDHHWRRDAPDAEIVFLAPTGSAALVLARALPNVKRKPRTLAKFVEDCKHRKKPFDRIFVLIDEASMLTWEDFGALITALNPGMTDEQIMSKDGPPLRPERIVLVGDSRQLGPVGCNRYEFTFFESLLRRPEILKVELTKLHRFKTEALRENVEHFNKIATHADFVSDDVSFTMLTDANDWDRVVYWVRKCCAGLPPGTQFLCTLNDTCAKLNDLLQRELNPFGREHENGIRTGDPIMCTDNFYDAEDELRVANGTMGRMEVDFDSKRHCAVYENGFRDVNRETRFVSAYAITVAKSQGGQFDNVILVCDFVVPDRSVLYTAISRAKMRCVVIGSATEIDRCLIPIRKRPAYADEELEAGFREMRL